MSTLRAIFALLFAMTLLPTVTLACGDEDSPSPSPDGTYELSEMNMTCRPASRAGSTPNVDIEYGWGACLTSQTVVISRNGASIADYAISQRVEPNRADLLRVKNLAHDGRLLTFKSAGGTAPNATLTLERDPKNDSRGKNWMGDIEELPAYTARLVVDSPSQGVFDLSCRTRPQQH